MLDYVVVATLDRNLLETFTCLDSSSSSFLSGEGGPASFGNWTCVDEVGIFKGGRPFFCLFYCVYS